MTLVMPLTQTPLSYSSNFTAPTPSLSHQLRFTWTSHFNLYFSALSAWLSYHPPTNFFLVTLPLHPFSFERCSTVLHHVTRYISRCCIKTSAKHQLMQWYGCPITSRVAASFTSQLLFWYLGRVLLPLSRPYCRFDTPYPHGLAFFSGSGPCWHLLVTPLITPSHRSCSYGRLHVTSPAFITVCLNLQVDVNVIFSFKQSSCFDVAVISDALLSIGIPIT